MTSKALSPKQKRILQCIRKFVDTRGYPPAVRDIASGCKISSTSVVAYNLARLETAGYIRRHAKISRGVEFLTTRQNHQHIVSVPIIGEIAAGEPIPVPHSETWDTIPTEELEVTEDLTRGKQRVYALRGKGSPLIDPRIQP